MSLCVFIYLPGESVIHPEPDLDPAEEPVEGILHLSVEEAVEEGQQNSLKLFYFLFVFYTQIQLFYL